MRIGRHFRSLAGQHEFSTLLPWSEPQVRPPSHGLCSRGSLHTVGSAIDCDTWPLVCREHSRKGLSSSNDGVSGVESVAGKAGVGLKMLALRNENGGTVGG